jgi:tetratricopeptide (TPR) repeat protein
LQSNRLSTVMSLFTLPRDSWTMFLRSSEGMLVRQARILFDCYVVAALTHYELGANQEAKEYLANARAAGPRLSETNPLFLLAAGQIEPDLEKGVHLLRQATEFAADFEIAQFALARHREAQFRLSGELSMAAARIVMSEYDRVLAINPGNIAALASQGYLLWLLGKLEDAKVKFIDGRENKVIARQTFTGELDYGLARIAAEEGRFRESYDLYTQTIAVEPGVAAHSVTAGSKATMPYYDNTNRAMVKRYAEFKKAADRKIRKVGKGAANGKKDDRREEISEHVMNVVHSLVLNDYGNACLNHFFAVGDPKRLDKAVGAFEAARTKDPDSKIVPYNLHRAYTWRGREEDAEAAEKCLEQAERLGPTWPISVFTLAQARLRRVQDSLKRTMDEAETQHALEAKERDSILAAAAGTTAAEPGLPPAQRSGQEGHGSARSLYAKAKKQQADRLRKVLPEVQKIMKTTRLSPIYDGFGFDTDGSGVDRLLNARVERDRFDENDVRGLRLWAEVLSSNIDNEQALRTAEKICSYILDRHYPGSFEVIRIARTMYSIKKRDCELRSKLETDGAAGTAGDPAIEESLQKLETYSTLMRRVVTDWVERNPTNYADLAWVSDAFGDKRDRDASEYKRDRSAAIGMLERAVRLVERNPVLWNLLGMMYQQDERYEEALEKYKEAVDLDPRTGLYHYNLGYMLWSLKRSSEAEEAFLAALKYEPQKESKKRASYWNLIGNTYFDRGQHEASVGYYEKAIALDPETAVHHANLGGALIAIKQWKPAQTSYLVAYHQDPRSAVYSSQVGYAAYGLEKYDEAADWFRKATELEPNAVLYHVNLAVAYEKLKRWKDAKNSLARAVKVDPVNAANWNYLGNTHYQMEEYHRALEAYEEAVARDPQTAVYRANVALALEKIKDWKGAAAAYRKTIDIEPQNPVYWNSLGNAHFNDTDYSGAADAYRKAIDFDGEKAVYRDNLGKALIRLERWDQAELAFRDAVRLEPKNADYSNNLGYALYRAKIYDGAADNYRKAIELDGDKAVYHGNLGTALRLMGLWGDAATAFRDAVKMDPENAEYWNNLGYMLYQAKIYDQAVDSYRKAIDLDPGQAVYRDNLRIALDEAGTAAVVTH